MPPSTRTTCPVIQLLCASSKKSIVLAIFFGSPISFIGFLSLLASTSRSVFKRFVDKLVSVKDGATTLKQTLALVYSDARALAMPSNADLDAAAAEAGADMEEPAPPQVGLGRGRR